MDQVQNQEEKKKLILEVSLEMLYHFRCVNCEKWWSIGDWAYASDIICPHCGQHLHNPKSEKAIMSENDSVDFGSIADSEDYPRTSGLRSARSGGRPSGFGGRRDRLSFSDEDLEDLQNVAGEMGKAAGSMAAGVAKTKLFGLPIWGWMLISAGVGLTIIVGLIMLIVAAVG